MFSVKGEIRDKIESLQEGAVDFVSKPFVVDDLIERVGRVLADARHQAGGAR
jgi:DNA-binding response OmpR family regulator